MSDYDDYSEPAETPEAAPDIPAIIEDGLSTLNSLKASMLVAETAANEARAECEDGLAAHKQAAQQAVTLARQEQSAALEALKAETDIAVQAARDEGAAAVAEAKARLDDSIADAVAHAKAAKEEYHNAVVQMSEWLAPSALAAMGHTNGRRGRKSAK